MLWLSIKKYFYVFMLEVFKLSKYLNQRYMKEDGVFEVNFYCCQFFILYNI